MRILAVALTGALLLNSGAAGALMHPVQPAEEPQVRTFTTALKTDQHTANNLTSFAADIRRIAALADDWFGIVQQNADLATRIEAARKSTAHLTPEPDHQWLLAQFTTQWVTAQNITREWDTAATRRAVEALEVTAQLLIASDARRISADARRGTTEASHLATEASRTATRTAPAPGPQPTRTTTNPRPTQTPAPAGAVKWATFVGNHGGQEAVDACTGGLTRWADDLQGRPYLPIHRSCGGAPILGLDTGDLVKISGGGLTGVWRVVDFADIPKRGGSYELAAKVDGAMILQTCYRGDTLSRLVGVVRN